MSDVFISYSKIDRPLAEGAANDLKARGFDVWWDYELYAGDDFHGVIRAEIAKAKAVVVIWSESAIDSRWVLGEADEAFHLGTLISTHAPNFDVRKVPFDFRTLRCEPIANLDRVVLAIERKGAKGKVAPQPAAPSIEADPHRDLRARAAAGDAKAQLQLGFKYAIGEGATKDEREAVRLYRLAAEQGRADARARLGWMYETGRGVAKDEREAVRLYRLAADQGDADAQFNLGFMYETGRGIAKDQKEAVRLYRLAADQGHVFAQANLGRMYEKGRVIAKDQNEVVTLYQRAAYHRRATPLNHS